MNLSAQNLKVSSIKNRNYFEVRNILNEQKLHTVCDQAGCPNKFECYGARTATFLIMGKNCTRNCSFCLIEQEESIALDAQEPYRIAEAVNKLGLVYVVITSVTRDDLPDGGASFFAETINWITKLSPKCLIEVLTPDFNGNEAALKCIFEAQPDVFNHNVETIKRLYPEVRPQADYEQSLDVLHKAKQHGLIVKSGLMVGLGETQQEIIDTMRDIRAAGCDILTIGQYLRPSESHYDVKRFYRVQEFNFLRQLGMTMNFKVVQALPLARSSYKAHESYDEVLNYEMSQAKEA